MKTPEIAAAVLMVFACTFSGWICLFRTEAVVARARSLYAKSRFHGLFAGLVQKPWYPNYLRCMGAFIWLFEAVLISMFVLTAVGR